MSVVIKRSESVQYFADQQAHSLAICQVLNCMVSSTRNMIKCQKLKFHFLTYHLNSLKHLSPQSDYMKKLTVVITAAVGETTGWSSHTASTTL